MKIKSVIKIIIYFVLFVACLSVALSGGYSYENVFPQKMNVFIEGRNPLDLPAKISDSEIARKYFATKTGMETKAVIEEAIRDVLFDLFPPEGEPAPLYFEKYNGFRVYMPGPPTTPEKTPETETESDAEGDNKAPETDNSEKPKIEPIAKLVNKMLASAPAIATGYQICLHGDPMALIEKQEGFIGTLEIGKRALLAKIVLPLVAVKAPIAPEARKELKMAFTIIGNLVVFGSPKDVKYAIDIQSGRKPALKDSMEWKPLKSRMNKKADLSIVILPENIIAGLSEDNREMMTMMAPMLLLNEIKALIIEFELGKKGIGTMFQMVSTKDSVILGMLRQKVEGNRKTFGIIPKGFGSVASIKLEDATKSWNKLKKNMENLPIVGEAIEEWEEIIKERFDTDIEDYLKLMENEIAIISYPAGGMTGTVTCVDIKSDAFAAFEGEPPTKEAPTATPETYLEPLWEEEEIPEYVGEYKIYTSKGESPVQYAKVEDFLCYGDIFSDLRGFLELGLEDPSGSKDVKAVIAELPKNPEILVLIDGLVTAKNTFDLDQDTVDFLKPFNTKAAIGIKIGKDNLVVKYFSGLKLFSGSTESSEKTRTKVILIAVKLLVYFIGIISLLLLISNVRKSMKSE